MKKLLKATIKIARLLTLGGAVVGYKDHIDNKRDGRKSRTIYEDGIKRGLDWICGMAALIVFWPLYLIVALLVKTKLGSPVLFTQVRPGRKDAKTGKETLFKLYKFRTMTDERDEDGNLLPDEIRLTKFGEWLRSTSLDELPEAFNIIKGDMSVIGPRPQLVRDMVFMTDVQRTRHNVRPGLSGLAQVRGRNVISWEKKLETDQEYIKIISLKEDARIVLETLIKFIKRDDITEIGETTATDFGDYLLKSGQIEKSEYDVKQNETKKLLKV